MMRLYTLLFAVILICSSFIESFAQQVIELDSIIITANRIPTTIKEASKSVSIISSKEINNLPIQSIDELIGMFAGVNVNTRNQFGVQADIGMRGSTFSQVVIMLDGMRLNDPLTAHFNNNIPVSLAEIDHIEIIRGPSSASFGADAVGGIIHIKTKAFVSNHTDEMHFTGNLEAGSHNSKRADVGFHYAKKKYSVSGSYKTSNADGETFINPNFLAGISTDSLYANFFDIATYSLAFKYNISPNLKLYSRAAFDSRAFKAKYFYTRSIYDESQETVKSKWWQNALVYTKNKHTLSLSTAYRRTNDRFTFNPLFAVNTHTSQQFLLNISDNYAVNERLKIAFGGQLMNKKVASNDRGNHQNLNGGIFVSTSYFLTGNIKTDVSFRVEYDENFGVEVIPQFGIAFMQKQYKIRSSIGRSIRSGDFTERYISSLIPNLSPGRNVGNPDLKAETAWSVDVGMDYFPKKSYGLSTTTFYRKSANLIDFTFTNASNIDNVSNLQVGEDYFYAQNVTNSTVFGVEFSAFKNIQLSDIISLKTQANYTYLHTKTGTKIVSKYISNHPSHQVNVLLNFRFSNFEISSNYRFLVRNEDILAQIDAKVKANYVVSNLKVGHDFTEMNFKVFGQIQNIFDTQYQEILGTKLPSRWFLAGIQWNLHANLK